MGDNPPEAKEYRGVPELPEVETVRRGLQPVLEGRVIVRADIRRPDLRWPFPTSMAKRLIGTRILRIRRRSKYILVDLSSGETLIVHLGMSGRILIADARLGDFHLERATAEKHDHVEIELDSGGCLTFNDPRRFGAMDLWPTEALEEHWLLAGLGPEPLGNEFDETYLVRRLRGRKTSVKAALLDQKTVAGLGNIYVCEALYRAGISPRRNAGKISERRAALMVPVIREVLGEAIEAGGSSLRDFRRTDGELGYFQHSFRVYDREGMSCRTHACTATIRRIVQSGRSTFYCPKCQR